MITVKRLPETKLEEAGRAYISQYISIVLSGCTYSGSDFLDIIWTFIGFLFSCS